MATREVEAMYCLVICQYKGGEEWLEGRWKPCIVWSFVSIKEVRNGYKGGGGQVCFVICRDEGGGKQYMASTSLVAIPHLLFTDK
jgi:hypothetical protein